MCPPVPFCIDREKNQVGYNSHYMAVKEIGEYSRSLSVGQFLLAIIPDNLDETIHLTINGSWASINVIEMLMARLNDARQIMDMETSLPIDIAPPLRILAAEINHWYKDTERGYWMAYLPPPTLVASSLFWLNGQLPDYNAIPFGQIVDWVKRSVEKHRK